MKLELKHLAPYLPYRLKIKTKHGWHTMETLNDWEVNGDHEESFSYEDHENQDVEFKPILRPLSDLTIDLFNELKLSSYMRTQIGVFGFNIEWGIMETCPYTDFEILLSNHFDVFGLIEEGLAIDINTLKS